MTSARPAAVEKDKPLSYAELAVIDQLHSRANSIRSEARARLNAYDWDLAVRRSQEAIELHMKALLRFIGKDYPRRHDLEKATYAISLLLACYGIGRQEVARMVLANSTLALWRAPSLYGDERLGITRLFGEKEARAAVGYADEVSMIVEKVRSQLYRASSEDRT